MSKKLIQFGAGNIGRSFIGQLFNQHGYEVVFVDLNQSLVELLNQQGAYRVVVKQSGREDQILEVTGVRAVDARDLSAVADEIAEADLAATAVGGGALPHLAPAFSRGLLARQQRHPDYPLDIILAENIRNGGEIMNRALAEHLPASFPLKSMVGLVETSIGKMVPIMPREALRVDPLWVFAEPYNTLILDRRGFRTPPPQLPEIKLVDNITAYVDRKLFIHNLGHAAVGYLGFSENPEYIYLWEALENPEVLRRTRQAMRQAAQGVAAEYPEDLSIEELHEHIEDLLNRFRNQALGDTVFRVGLDLRRKLGRHDRIVGAMLLNRKHGLECEAIVDVLLAALDFRATGEDGKMFPADDELIENEFPHGLDYVLEHVCGLSPENSEDSYIMDLAKARNRQRAK